MIGGEAFRGGQGFGWDCRKFLRSWIPEDWLFSGWNWTAVMLFLATAETKGEW